MYIYSVASNFPHSKKLRYFQLEALRASAQKWRSALKQTLGAAFFLKTAACCHINSSPHWDQLKNMLALRKKCNMDTAT